MSLIEKEGASLGQSPDCDNRRTGAVLDESCTIYRARCPVEHQERELSRSPPDPSQLYRVQIAFEDVNAASLGDKSPL